MRTKTLGLALLSSIAFVSCAASVAGSSSDVRDVTDVESGVDASAFDAIVVDDGRAVDDRDGVEVFDTGVPLTDTPPERDGVSGEVTVSRDDVGGASDARDEHGPDPVADATTEASAPRDAERECENFNAGAACAVLYETTANDPGARFVCCNGRCVSGIRCNEAPGFGRCLLGPQDPRGCNLSDGQLCCYSSRGGAPYCVPRDQGRCRLYN